MMSRVNGHFGEWLQGRLGPDGPVVLVTVRCPALFIEAELLKDGPFGLEQREQILESGNAEAFVDDLKGQMGTYRVSGNILPGGGAGASTAALVALGRAAGGQEDALAEACIAAEGASDPLMLLEPDRELWASREGRSLSSLPPLPSAEIVGGYWGEPIATNASDMAFPDISDLAAMFQEPLSLQQLGAVSSESARRCSALRGPTADPTPLIAGQLGALGYIRSHTGSARGLIFEPGTAPENAEDALTAAGYSRCLKFLTGGER